MGGHRCHTHSQGEGRQRASAHDGSGPPRIRAVARNPYNAGTVLLKYHSCWLHGWRFDWAFTTKREVSAVEETGSVLIDSIMVQIVTWEDMLAVMECGLPDKQTQELASELRVLLLYPETTKQKRINRYLVATIYIYIYMPQYALTDNCSSASAEGDWAGLQRQPCKTSCICILETQTPREPRPL